MPNRFYILVDYDNFAKNVFGGKDRNMISLDAISDTARLLAGSSSFFDGAEPKGRIQIRLYGGWFYRDKDSHDAQDLIGEILSRPSGTFKLNESTPLYVDFQLARAMLSMNGNPFYATCRVDRYNYTCPDCKSSIKGSDVRQKLVDTMLGCDFIRLSDQGEHVAVVTSDDDLIPPLFQQAALGKPVFHVLTTSYPASSFTDFYDPIHPDGYHCIPRD